MTRCCPRKAPTTPSGCARSGSGSSIRWTVPANSRNSAVTTGRYTSHCGRTANSSRVQSPLPRRGSRLPRRPSPRRRRCRTNRESLCPAPARPPSRWRSVTRLAVCSSKWARPEPKSPRWCRAVRRLRARRWAVRVGLRSAGRRRPCGRTAHVSPRRLAAAIQPARPTAARFDRVSAGTGRGGTRGHVQLGVTAAWPVSRLSVGCELGRKCLPRLVDCQLSDELC